MWPRCRGTRRHPRHVGRWRPSRRPAAGRHRAWTDDHRYQGRCQRACSTPAPVDSTSARALGERRTVWCGEPCELKPARRCSSRGPAPPRTPLSEPRPPPVFGHDRRIGATRGKPTAGPPGPQAPTGSGLSEPRAGRPSRRDRADRLRPHHARGARHRRDRGLAAAGGSFPASSGPRGAAWRSSRPQPPHRDRSSRSSRPRS